MNILSPSLRQSKDKFLLTLNYKYVKFHFEKTHTEIFEISRFIGKIEPNQFDLQIQVVNSHF